MRYPALVVSQLLGLALGIYVLAACTSAQTGAQTSQSTLPPPQAPMTAVHSVNPLGQCDTPVNVTLNHHGGTLTFPKCGGYTLKAAYSGIAEGSPEVTIEDGLNNYLNLEPPTNGGNPIFYLSIMSSTGFRVSSDNNLKWSFSGRYSEQWSDGLNYALDFYKNGSYDATEGMAIPTCGRSDKKCRSVNPSFLSGLHIDASHPLEALIAHIPS
jgi:hypothetical protein